MTVCICITVLGSSIMKILQYKNLGPLFLSDRDSAEISVLLWCKSIEQYEVG